MVGEKERVETGLLRDSYAGANRRAVGLRTHVADCNSKLHRDSSGKITDTEKRLASVRASSQTTRPLGGDKRWGVHRPSSASRTISMRSSTWRSGCSASGATTAVRST